MRRLEVFIRAHPEQWHMPHEIWPGDHADKRVAERVKAS